MMGVDWLPHYSVEGQWNEFTFVSEAKSLAVCQYSHLSSVLERGGHTAIRGTSCETL